MMRGMAGLSLIAAGAFCLYLKAFLQELPVLTIVGGIVAVLVGIWLMGTRRFDG